MTITKAFFLCLFLLLPSIAQAQTEPATASTQMIANGGHKIAFHVTPGRLPAIVFDAGGGGDSSYWNKLVPEIAKRTGSRIITYDRASMGESDDVPGPWNLKAATEDLATGLKELGATHNVILVSFSLGGEIATSITGEHPDWFTGAVLIDANVPDVFSDNFIATQWAAQAPAFAKMKENPPTNKSGRQMFQLLESWREQSHAFHEMTWPSSVPAIVIVSEKTPLRSESDAQWWRDAHAQFAKRADNRRLVTADHSSHDVARDRPDIVLQAIDDIVALRR